MVAAAAVSDEYEISCRLPNGASIYTAEARGILSAFTIIRHTPGSHFIIFSDSRSCLQALNQSDPDNPLIAHVLKIYNKITTKYRKDVKFCWIPSHIGIRGNEKADKLAKKALASDVSINEMIASDFKSKIGVVVRKKHQDLFDGVPSNKLRTVEPEVGKSILNTRSFKRRTEIVLTRLRIGHCHLTHAFLLKGENAPQCVGCQCPLTVVHFMLNCTDFALVRNKYFNEQSMKELFCKVAICDIINFLREINLLFKM